ncbi:hypothetical protein R5R35_001725 [Gryllus longicercus]|uniref:Accessory gland protein n=1 Tax=Gryllus longicercus TaxID=2509291 RepID=A0AAN9ZG00_9ORTH
MRVNSVMLLPVVLAAVLAEEGGGKEGEGRRIRKKEEPKLSVMKCCRADQMLSSDGRKCVDATWPANETQPLLNKTFLGRPFNERWLSRWLPRGIALNRVHVVLVDALQYVAEKPLVRKVEDAVIWDERQAEKEGASYWRSNRVVFYEFGILRPFRSDTRLLIFSRVAYEWTRNACVDAAQEPLAPFVVLIRANCGFDDCIVKCCDQGQVFALQGGGWKCQEDAKGYWTPTNATFSSVVLPETSFQYGYSIHNLYERLKKV